MNSKTVLKIFFAFLVLVALSLPFWLTPDAAELRTGALTQIGNLLTTLFIVALLLERALDLFLTTWRAEASEKMDMQIEQMSKSSSTLSSDQQQRLEQMKSDRLARSSETRLIALWVGLVLGIIISAVGIRAIETLIDPADLEGIQKTLFHFIDVFLTGALIAGGSEGIHKVMELYRAFIDESKAKAKAPSSN